MAAQPEDAKSYYGYLIEGDDKNKRATPVLEALLRAIAQYIIDEIGDKNDKHLTPPKLAAFYKAVGGDYDALFYEVPYISISYIWQVTGCQHTLQPCEDDYLEPNIPALTIKGFVRWETIEILLAPEEHVPFMQHAVRHWNLKNADDGKTFPPDLPREAFPAETDPEIDRWHRECATKLRSESTPKDETKDGAKDEQKHTFHDSGHRVRDFYNHVRVPAAVAAGMAAGGVASMSAAAAAASARLRPDHDYFAARPVGVSYSSGRYPPSRQGSGMAPRSPERERDKDRYPRRHGSSSDERRPSGPRRRSFSDYPSPVHGSPVMTQGMHAPHFDQKEVHKPRRHSQPRHYSSPSDSDEPVSPETKRREPPAVHQHHHHRHPSPDPPLTAGVRRVYPTPASLGARSGVPMPTAVPPVQIPVPPHADDRVREERHRASSGSRSDEPRRKSFPTPHDLKDRLVSMIPGLGIAERPRSGSRGHRERDRDRDREKERARFSHEHLPSTSSRLGHSWSNEDGDSEGESEEERARRRRREREREREREHERRLRDRERDRDRNPDRHVDRRDRDRERDRDRDRERERDKDRDRRRGRDKAGDRPARERDSTDESLSPRSRKNTSGSSSSYLQRPDVPRRPSSHADLDRRRERDRDLGWDRDRDRGERWRREERERMRQMDRDRDRMPSPVVTGVGGRRYPTELGTG